MVDYIEINKYTSQLKLLLKRKLLIITLLFVLVNVLATLFFLLTSPVALQKSLSIKSGDVVELFDAVDYKGLPNKTGVLDVGGFIKDIPFKKNTQMQYLVLPRSRYEKSIQEGEGNCSNLIYGAAFYLIEKKQAFQIVHLLPIGSFLNGKGHTVINIQYWLDSFGVLSGIVDVKGAGLPITNGHPITLRQLIQHDEVSRIMPLNSVDTNSLFYYDKKFLDGAVIGLIPSESVVAYFGFIEKIYVPLMGGKFDKYFFDGLSLIYGFFPETVVSSVDYGRLFDNNLGILYIAKVWLWTCRVIHVLFVLWSLVLIKYVINRLIYRY